MHLTREKVQVILDHVESSTGSVVGKTAIQSTPILPLRRVGGGQRMDETPRAAACGLVALTGWQVRTYSATSTSWPTENARRRTSDPVLVLDLVLDLVLIWFDFARRQGRSGHRAVRHGTPGAPARVGPRQSRSADP